MPGFKFGMALTVAALLSACQAGKAFSPGGMPGASTPSSFSNPANGGAGASGPGSGSGPGGPVSDTPPADGTLGSQTDTPDINHLDMYTYGTDPRTIDPAAKKGVVRIVFWPSDAAVQTLWMGLGRKQIVDKIKAEGVTWDLVQPAKWKDTEIAFTDDASTWTAADTEAEDGAFKLYFWLPPNTIPMASTQSFADLDQFMALFK